MVFFWSFCPGVGPFGKDELLNLSCFFLIYHICSLAFGAFVFVAERQVCFQGVALLDPINLNPLFIQLSTD